MEMVVFSGVQGAGKSTYFSRHFAMTHVRISLDMLKTRNREDILLFACLAAQQSVVVDNTDPTAAQRARYSALAKAAGFRTTLYFFDVTFDDAMARNQLRPGSERIPEVGVRGTFAKLERPIVTEPFDRILILSAAENCEWNVKELKS